MRRRGLSYLEVLIASGIALTGILGLLAIYPVAIMNLRKGQTVDVAAAIGPSAINSVSALHVDDPTWWIASTPIQPTDCLCIDPRFVASVASWDATQSDPTLFPSVAMSSPLDARMRRVTLWSGAPGNPKPAMSSQHARLLFKSQDDLLFERATQPNTMKSLTHYTTWPHPPPAERPQPVDRESPAVQFYADNGKLQRRDYFADFEAIYTLVPQTDFSSGTFASTGYYDLSAVIFRERAPDLTKILTAGSDPNFVEDERVCDVMFHTPGYNGGDVTATIRAGRPESDLNVAQTSWALVSGVETVTNNSFTPPVVGLRPVFQWYRVTAFSEVYGGKRDLTLDGPDWFPNTSNLRITFVSGVVSVFTERMQVK